VFANLMREFEQEASEATGNGLRKRDAACILQCKAVLLADALNRAHLGFAMIAEESEKAFTLDGSKLRRCQRLGRDFVDSVGEGCVEAQNRAGAGDAHDHLSVLGTSGGQFQIAAADQIKAAGVFTLGKERSLGGQADGAGYQFEISQYGAAKRTKPTGLPIAAGCTANGRLAIDHLLPSLGRRCNS
jgi:hypothetical protein